MITRLKIQGFKNLFDTEMSFGPFNCIAGLNSVGKSNLFDAIQFIRNTTEFTLIESASRLRSNDSKGDKHSDITAIFYKDEKYQHKKILFDLDLIIPSTGTDHLGQEAKATITAVRYILEIELNSDAQRLSNDLLKISREELLPIKKSDILKTLKIHGANKKWIQSVIKGKRQNSTPFFTTDKTEHVIVISQDQQWGRKKKIDYSKLPRTILSTSNSTEMPTALITKLELQSWNKLQFEPSALRSSDDFYNPAPFVSSTGGHLPGTLYRLKNDHRITYNVFSEIANRLSELINSIFNIDVDVDEKRNIITLLVKGKNRAPFPASSLSDGTLRFLALSIIEQDPNFTGVICLEEPENGIHPERIPAIIELLYDIAMQLDFESNFSNPLRQVIINTHSPLVVAEIKSSDLVFATEVQQKYEDKVVTGVKFKHLSRTWRSKIENPDYSPVSKSTLLKYLNPYYSENKTHPDLKQKTDRVLDRAEIRQLSFFSENDDND